MSVYRGTRGSQRGVGNVIEILKESLIVCRQYAPLQVIVELKGLAKCDLDLQTAVIEHLRNSIQYLPVLRYIE